MVIAGEYESEDEGCDNSTLPFINGPGTFLPHKRRYEQGDVVTLECAQGYLAQADGALAFCHSGYFDPYISTCVKVGRCLVRVSAVRFEKLVKRVKRCGCCYCGNGDDLASGRDFLASASV